jgi:hypothetical protein
MNIYDSISFYISLSIEKLSGSALDQKHNQFQGRFPKRLLKNPLAVRRGVAIGLKMLMCLPSSTLCFLAHFRLACGIHQRLFNSLPIYNVSIKEVFKSYPSQSPLDIFFFDNTWTNITILCAIPEFGAYKPNLHSLSLNSRRPRRLVIIMVRKLV